MGQLLVKFRENSVVHEGMNTSKQLVKDIDDLLKTKKEVFDEDFNKIGKLLPHWNSIVTDKKNDIR